MSRFICVLANSIKFGGRCIAGKEVFPAPDGGPWTLSSTWLRPLGSSVRGELLFSEYSCSGRTPGILDIVDIPFGHPQAVVGQPEDWSIIPRQPWVYHGTFNPGVSARLLDAPNNLWLEFPNHTDRVSTTFLLANQLPSLQLVQVSNLSLHLQSSINYHTQRPMLKRRCHFQFGNTYYDIALTDPLMQARYFPSFPNCSSGPINPGPAANSIICVSLSPALGGMHYKLAAAII